MKKAMTSALPSVEPLEARIAPATLTFVDIDGDLVTITTSKGTKADLEAAVLLIDSGEGKLLQEIDLTSNPVFRGSNLSIIAEVGGSGDGVVNIGYINATGLDLGRVTVDGDVGQIDAGDSKFTTPAMKALQIGSLGAQGLMTQEASSASLISNIQGPLSKLVVTGNVLGTLEVSAGNKPSAGRIDSIQIGGALIGGTEQYNGAITASGAIKSIQIGGLQGGTAANSGYIEAASIKSLIVEKSLIGGDGEFSGSVRVWGNIKKVEVGEHIIGGLATTSHDSGEIRANGAIKNVHVIGQVKGGGGTNSGAITSGLGIGKIQVDGGIVGGGGTESGSIGTKGSIQKVTIGTDAPGDDGLTGGGGAKSGSVLASAKITAVTINGNISGGEGTYSGVIATAGGLTRVTVNGSVIGGEGPESGAIGSTKALGSVYIAGNLEGGDGQQSGAVVSSTSIGSVVIGGDVLGGSQYQSGTIGSLGPVGSVKIGGNLEGRDGYRSGAILSATGLKKIVINGSLIGGTESESGAILTPGVIGSVTIDQDLRGGDWFRSGLIEGFRVDSVLIGGSVFGGSEWRSGSILATDPGFTEEPRRQVVRKPSGNTEPTLGTIKVLGSVYGGNGPESGSFISEGQINSITIGRPGLIIDEEIPRNLPVEGEEFPILLPRGGGSLEGGSEYRSGSILAEGNIGSVTIFGSLIGGYQAGEALPYYSGSIAAGGDIKKVTIGRDLVGGESSYDVSEGGAEGAGQVYARGRIGLVDIGGSVIGSYGENSATVRAGTIGTVKVAGDVSAGPGSYSASFIADEQDIKSIQIGGDLTTYTGIYDPQMESEVPAGYGAASIAAARNLGKVEIGAIVGHSEARVTISARGQLDPGSDAQALAIGSVTVRHGTYYADILAGYDLFGFSENPNAQIGTVTVGEFSRNSEPSTVWESTNVVAGAHAGWDGIFGTDDDLLIPDFSESGSVISKIARVIINGFIENNGGEGEEILQGIVAAQVGSVTLLGDKAPLKSGPRNDTSVTFPSAPALGINEPNTSVLPV